jgi:dihydrofolate reductase
MITAIYRTDCNGKMGKNGTLGRILKSDMKFFAEMTANSIVIMGSQTFFKDMDGEPLKNRLNIVLTTKKEPINVDGVIYAKSIQEAISLAYAHKAMTGREIFVIGGASILDQFYARNFIDKAIVTVYNKDEKDFDVQIKHDIDKDQNFTLEKTQFGVDEDNFGNKFDVQIKLFRKVDKTSSFYLIAHRNFEQQERPKWVSVKGFCK